MENWFVYRVLYTMMNTKHALRIVIAMDSRCFEGNVCIDVLELNT